MGKRARRPEARPDEILDAAIAVFSARGFAGARVEDIAAAAGLSKGAIYLYFDSKLEMLKAIVRRLADRVVGAAEGLVDSGEGDAEMILRALATFMVAQLSDPKTSATPRIVIAEAQRFPEVAAYYRDHVIARGQRMLDRLIDLGVKQGVFRDIDRAAILRGCFGPILAHMLLSSVFADPKAAPPAPDLVAAGLADMILHGLKTSPGASR